MKTKDFIVVLALIVLYISLLVIFKPSIFRYSFSQELIRRYFLSQDIPHEVPGKRLFLSDGDIYLSTGYLYAQGEDPAKFNFEHPPLIKYLFGFSIKFFNNPYFAQILLGVLMIIALYYAGIKIYRQSTVASLACLLLLIDPIFLSVSSEPLLDLGQALFLILYILAVLYFKKNYMLQGAALGLFAGTKFWITPIFFIVALTLYKLYKREFEIKIFFLHLIFAFITYSLLYTQTFILYNDRFNIVWHILRTFKYRLIHNTSQYFGASFVLFMTGFLKSWWGNKKWIWISPWTIIWPISLVLSITESFRLLLKKKIDINFFIGILPFLYLCYLGVQASFPRYFMPILPFLYLFIANLVLKKRHLLMKS